MLNLIFPMSAVLATWTLLILLFIGIGLLFQRLWGQIEVDTNRVVTAFWLGLAMTIALLQIWHLALPITSLVWLPITAAAIAGHSVTRHKLYAWATIASRQRILILMIVVLAAWCANRAIGPGTAHDSGLYHYNVIRWQNTYPIVPGLANLHSRLAFNNSSLLYNSLLNTGPWHGRANHLSNGLLLVMLAIQISVSAARLLRTSNKSRFPDIFNLTLIGPLVMMAVSKEASSPRTDLPLAVMLFVVTWRLLVLFGDRDTPPNKRAHEVILIGTLSTAVVGMKLSGAAFALPAWLLAVGYWLAKDRPTLKAARPVFAWVVGLSVILMLGWSIRSAVLSGYPLFPSQLGALDVQWRLPTDVDDGWQFANFRRWACYELPQFIQYGVARSPLRAFAPLMDMPGTTEETLQGWGWVRPWFFAQVFGGTVEIFFPILMIAFATLTAIISRLKCNNPSTQNKHIRWVLIPLFTGAAFWFVVAPEPRYGYGPMWALAAGITAVVFGASWDSMNKFGRSSLLIACVVTAISAIGFRVVVNRALHKTPIFTGVPFHAPGTDHGFHPLPIGELETQTTRWGLQLRVPITKGLLSWDAPLPCTPFPESDLRLRQSSNLSAGFYIDRSGAASGTEGHP